MKDERFKWLDDLKDSQAVTVRRSRCYFIRPTNFELIEFHGFADSSTVAFASLVYLRIVYEDETDTTLVISKNKIALIKRPSMPRLELLAGLIISRSVHCTKEALKTPIRVPKSSEGYKSFPRQIDGFTAVSTIILLIFRPVDLSFLNYANAVNGGSVLLGYSYLKYHGMINLE